MKRLMGFFITVLVLTGVMAFTTPGLLDKVRLGLDLKGGFEILYHAEPMEAGAALSRASLLKTAESLEKRANALGTSEPEVTTEGTDRIRLKIAGVTDEAEVRKKMKEPAVLTFRSAAEGDAEGTYSKIELVGSDFVEGAAEVGRDNLNQPIISIKIKDKDKFAEITKRLLGKNLAIYLDENKLSDPTVQAVLTDGSASISGNYTIKEARELADTINLGALPLKLTEKYSQSVGATLGKQSLDQTIRAGLLASVIILIFMIGMYRLPGLLASFALLLHTWALIAVFVFADFTLTLPGIAAFILGIGMAVDANIITNERIREEMRSGKVYCPPLKRGINPLPDSNGLQCDYYYCGSSYVCLRYRCGQRLCIGADCRNRAEYRHESLFLPLVA